MTQMKDNALTRLTLSAAKKGMEIVVPIDGTGKDRRLMIEARVRGDKKIIDREVVRKSEIVEKAAERMLTRMTRDRILG